MHTKVFLPTITACRSAGLLWFAFLILAKARVSGDVGFAGLLQVLFESLTLDTLVSAYIRTA